MVFAESTNEVFPVRVLVGPTQFALVVSVEFCDHDDRFFVAIDRTAVDSQALVSSAPNRLAFDCDRYLTGDL